jgi:hypothetical protein
MLHLIAYLLQAPLASFMDFFWFLDGDCFRC